MKRKLSAHIEQWKLAQPFRIAGKQWQQINHVVVEITESGVTGRGEATGVFFVGETCDSIYEQIIAITNDIERNLTRSDLLSKLPPGGARNAIDCALWDLETGLSNKSIWDLTRIEFSPTSTAVTIGIGDTPEEMGDAARQLSNFPILKVKLDGELPVERVSAVREARPDAVIVVDANQSFSFELLKDVMPRFSQLGVAMVEQPLGRGRDHELEGFEPPIPLCADESCMHVGELDEIASRYQMINIKLDKTGGLTAALTLAYAARAKGLDLMVGNMLGTSLAIAPAMVVAQLCKFVDLDGPLLLRHDRPSGLKFDNHEIKVESQGLWGSL